MAEHLYRDSYEVQASAYESAGDASASIKRKLKQMGVDSTILRRIAVASYEAELNLIIHSQGGQLVMEMTPEEIRLISRDVGPGIADIDQALQEGFGAGMGLPNMKRNADSFDISSKLGEGTTIHMGFRIA